MSTTIDNKVVEMRFDNKHFESNVQTSMSTLDKLKQKLNLTGASKGLDSLNAAANRIDFSKMEATATKAGFNIQDVWLKVASTFETQVAGKIVNAAGNMLKALTIDPITTGFSEYETQINATQTILANTQSKGSTIDDVNKALEELNAYADMTIYNFTEMTRNIGTFTAAGVDLETSVNAIQGIANLAAVSGSTSQQASTAMYQLSQALATGTVKLMDWNSVVNAGMGGQVFQDALKKTSKLLGTGAEAAIKAEGSFRESLKTGWLTSEVLTETLKKFTSSGANEYVAEYTGLSTEAVQAALDEAEARYGEADAIKYASEALAEKSGKNKKEIQDALTFAKTAQDAATKVKTFTQLWDVMKEAAQSGWSKTWKLIVGDFEQAKSLLTPLADFLTGIINKFSDWRNAILESALTKNFKDLADRIRKILDPVTDAVDTVKGALLDYDKLVDEIIAGKWKNAPTRWQDLAAAGYDWAHAQNLVNERLGCSKRHATNYVEGTKQVTKATAKTTEAQADLIEELVNLSAAELRAKGYTREQIQALKELKRTADKLGLSVKDLWLNIDEIDGRWLLVNSFKNIGKTLVTIFKSIGDAWNDAFGISTEEAGNKLFDLLAAFHKFTTKIQISKETADNLTRTLKGVFAILDLLLMVVGGPIKIAFKLLCKILSLFNLDFLEVTAIIGDVIVKFRDFVEGNNLVMKALEALVNIVKNVVLAFWELEWVQKIVKSIKKNFLSAKNAVTGGFTEILDTLNKLVEGVRNGSISFSEAIKTFGGVVKKNLLKIPLVNTIYKWIKAFLALPEVQRIINSVKDSIIGFKNAVGGKFGDIFGHLKKTFSEAVSIGKNLIAGIQEGLKAGTLSLKDAMIKLGTFILDTIKKILGIHSPSVKFFEIGKNIIQGLINGIGNGLSSLWKVLKNIGSEIINFLGKIDWGAVFSTAILSGFLIIGIKLLNVVEMLAEPLEGLGEMFKGFGKMLRGAGAALRGVGNFLNAKAFFEIAKGLLVLVGAIFILTLLDPGAVWNAVGVIAALATVMSLLTAAVGKFGPKEVGELSKFTLALLSISASVLLLAIAVKSLGSMSGGDLGKAFLVVLGLAGIVVGLVAASNLIGPNAEKIGLNFLLLAGSLLILVKVIKQLSSMDGGTIAKGLFVISLFGGLIIGLMAATKLMGGNYGVSSFGGMILKVAGALLLIIMVAKIAAKMSPEEMKRGIGAVAAFAGIIAALMLSTKLIGNGFYLKAAGGAILKMGFTMLLMVFVAKIAAAMAPNEILKGTLVIGLFGLMIVGLVKAVGKAAGSKLQGVMGTLIAVALAIGILAGVMALVSFMKPENLVKGIIVVGLLSTMMTMLIKSLKGANNITGSLVVLTVAMVALAGIVIGLSFLDPKKLFTATAALAILLVAFSSMIAASKLAGSDKSIVKNLLMMVGATAILAGIVVALSFIDPNGVISNVVALSILMGTLTLCLTAINKIWRSSTASIKSLAMLGLVVAELAIILGLMSHLKVEGSVTSAIAISVLLMSMASVLRVLSKIGPMASGAYAGIGALALIGLVAGEIGLIIGLLNKFDLNASLKNVLSISTMLAVMTGVLTVLSVIGPLATGAYAGIGAMAVLGLVVGELGLIMGLLNKFDLNSSVTDAIALSVLLYAMAKVLIPLTTIGIFGPAAFVGIGALATLITGMGVIITALGWLFEKCKSLEGFLDKGIAILGKIGYGIGLFIGSLVGGVIGGIAGGILSILPMLGLSLSQFMINAMPFIAGVKLIDETVLSGVAILTAAIIALCAAQLIEGITSFLTFGGSFASLGKQLSDFAIAAQPFIDVCSNLDPTVMEGVKNLAGAVLALTAANFLDGIARWITGENNLGNFGSQLGQFGTDFKTFVSNLGTFTEEQVTTVKCAGEAIKALASAAKSIPNEGGLWALIVGDNSIASFGDKLPGLGTDLNGFITNLGTFDEASIATVKCAGEAIKALASAAKSIPNEGGLWAKIVGDNSLATFGKKLPGLATNIKGYVKNLGTFGEDKIATVNASVKVMQAIAKLGKIDLKDTSSGLTKLGDKLGTFAKKISSFVKAMGDIGGDSVSSAIKKTNDLVKMAKSAASTNVESLKTFGTSLKKVATEGIKGFVAAFTDESPKEKVKKAAGTIATTFTKALDKKVESFKGAGKDLANGLIKGINSKKQAVYDAAYALGQKAVQGEKDGQKSKSPSKLTEQAGIWLGEGLIIGMNNMGNSVYKTGKNLGSSAVQSISSTISRIGEMINTDIDSQPTIRPVLDLSEVVSGAGAINGLFTDPSLGITSKVNTISSMMNNRQNGSNEDVVSAINKLRKDLGNVGGTTNYIDGINVGNDEEINNAIGTLVRAARMGGRA